MPSITYLHHKPLLLHPTRKEHISYYGTNYSFRREDGCNQIQNPTLDVLEPGQMCSYWVHRNTLSKKTAGLIIKEIDKVNKKVLVGHAIGGTLEHWDWIDASELSVVWGNGKTFKEMMELIGAFQGAVEKCIAAQEAVLSKKPPPTIVR